MEEINITIISQGLKIDVLLNSSSKNSNIIEKDIATYIDSHIRSFIIDKYSSNSFCSNNGLINDSGHVTEINGNYVGYFQDFDEDVQRKMINLYNKYYGC